MTAAIVRPTEEAVAAVVWALARGELCVIPTDTVYGVAATIAPEPVRRLYRAKGRPESRPIPVLVAGLDAVRELAAEWTRAAEALAEAFWPGALTMVVPARDWLPVEVTGGLGTVGLRWPRGSLVEDVIGRAGGMLAVTSANRSGEPPTVTAKEAALALGEAVTYVLDGGSLAGHRASTVVTLDTAGARILREGPIGRQQIDDALRSRQVGTTL